MYEEDDIVKVYNDNPFDKTYSLILVINNEQEIKEISHPQHWLRFFTDNIQNINNIRIYMDGNFLREIIFENDIQRETFKNNNYIMTF